MELREGCNEERALLPAAWQVEVGDARHQCCNEASVDANDTTSRGRRLCNEASMEPSTTALLRGEGCNTMAVPLPR